MRKQDFYCGRCHGKGLFCMMEMVPYPQASAPESPAQREENMMTENTRRQEIEEAVKAGEKALISLKAAKDKLSSAKSWGIWDIIGGGLISSMAKHSRINEASSYLERAKMDLRIFQRELRDVPDFSCLGIDIGGFLSFADFFLDGLVADCMVQSKICDAIRQVDHAIEKVEALIGQMRSGY